MRYCTQFALVFGLQALHCCSSAPTCEDESTCGSEAKASSLLQAKASRGTTVLEEDATSATETVVDSQTATARERQRVKLVIEGDLSRLPSSYYRAWQPEENCSENAQNAFEHVMEHLGEAARSEMTPEERAHYKLRFVSELEYDCKHDEEVVEHWEEDCAHACEFEKPAFTEALASSINDAYLGFTTMMQPWLLTESKRSFEERLGKHRDESENHTMFMQTQKYLAEWGGARNSVPTSFDSANTWPACSDVIKRTHNQGVCGSCWAFGAAGTLDSRLCIATEGRFQAQVSRGYATSCGKSGDGCQGGLARYAYQLAGGIPTGGATGCSPYFGHGEGTDHFQQQSSAPPCPSQCHSDYARPLSQDKFNLPSITFREIWPTNAEGNRMAKESMMAHGPLSFGVYASGSGFSGYSSGVIQNGCNPSPNHEVYAYGWGPGKILGMNSWGAHWGMNGGFELAECSVTDWTIVGDIRADVGGLPLPLPGTDDAPLPGPSPGPSPPAPPSGGDTWNVITGSCVKDAAGCISSTNFPQDYPNNDHCTIRADPGFGQIEVVDFNTESSYDKIVMNRYGISGSGYNTRPSLHHDLVPSTDITWTSDGSVTAGGWKLCPKNLPAPAPPAPAPATPAPTPAPATPSPTPSPTPAPATPAPTPGATLSDWQVDGPCPVVGNCVTSSNYPAAYNSGEMCTITGWPMSPVTLEDFETEGLWDRMDLNGVTISGSQERKQGIEVTSQITWTSDGATTNRGWRLCGPE